jgi:hypothetical protein
MAKNDGVAFSCLLEFGPSENQPFIYYWLYLYGSRLVLFLEFFKNVA